MRLDQDSFYSERPVWESVEGDFVRSKEMFEMEKGTLIEYDVFPFPPDGHTQGTTISGGVVNHIHFAGSDLF